MSINRQHRSDYHWYVSIPAFVFGLVLTVSTGLLSLLALFLAPIGLVVTLPLLVVGLVALRLAKNPHRK